MADWNDILYDNNEQLSDAELLKYLDKNIPNEEKHIIEEKTINNPFEADALQGLSQLQNKDNLKKHITQLNQKLHLQLSTKKRKQKIKIKIFEWLVVAIILLLFVCIISYIILYLQNKSHIHSQLLHVPKVLLISCVSFFMVPA